MRETIERLVDDLDGGEADETVTFGLDGWAYEIDLSTDNAVILRERLEEFAKNGRRMGRMTTGSSRPTSRPRAAVNGNGESKAGQMRDWGRDHGYEVNDRGRISKEVRQAYEQAHAS